MVIVRHDRQETFVSEGPAEITPNNVMFWCSRSEDLKKGDCSKASRFLKLDCVKYVGDSGLFGQTSFIVLPINTADSVVYCGREFSKVAHDCDYNSTVYEIRRLWDGETFVCNCQGWHAKHRRGEIEKGRAGCSHVLALYYAFKCGLFRNSKVKQMELIKK